MRGSKCMGVYKIVVLEEMDLLANWVWETKSRITLTRPVHPPQVCDLNRSAVVKKSQKTSLLEFHTGTKVTRVSDDSDRAFHLFFLPKNKLIRDF